LKFRHRISILTCSKCRLSFHPQTFLSSITPRGFIWHSFFLLQTAIHVFAAENFFGLVQPIMFVGAFVVFVVGFLFLLYSKKRVTNAPGPIPWPFIGSLLLIWKNKHRLLDLWYDLSLQVSQKKFLLRKFEVWSESSIKHSWKRSLCHTRSRFC
jgi:hypothetical protein